ncbi:MAG TPA: DUF6498-containing protein [Candidatus Limnocylindrales bacterium]|nr:DUF6498-containing protein [Candidatus Limnocylindrales bacterium]
MDRILAWYRLGSSIGAVVALVVANVIPLVGVLFFGWSVWNILVIYWLENGIVGVINVLKMSAATGDEATARVTFVVDGRPSSSATKFGLIPFFVVHYGIFWFVHGIFVLTLPAFFSLMSDDGMTLDLGPVLFAAAGLAVSHGLSFWWNFLRGGEYRRTSAAALMFAPYKRLVALHVTIIFGAFAVMFTGAPAAAVAVLVAIKTAIDLGLHLADHRGDLAPRGVVTS